MRGEADDVPQLIKFQQNCRHGVLLATVGWLCVCVCVCTCDVWYVVGVAEWACLLHSSPLHPSPLPIPPVLPSPPPPPLSSLLHLHRPHPPIISIKNHSCNMSLAGLCLVAGRAIIRTAVEVGFQTSDVIATRYLVGVNWSPSNRP